MFEAPGLPVLEETPPQAIEPDLHLLVELEPRPAAFFGNVRDAIRPRQLPPLQLKSAPAPFWPDVFVKRELPWRRFLQSGGVHILAFAFFLAASRFIAMQPQPVAQTKFDKSQVVYYQPAEYLPPLDTRQSQSAPPRQADPEFSRQPVISVPAEADNRTQTIVTPPDVRLNHDMQLPNIVSWADKPQMPIAPAPVVPASSITRISPLENSVVAPPPENVRTTRRDLPAMQTSVVAPPPELRSATRTVQGPQASVIAPPPTETDSTRRMGDINIGRTAVIAPAPQLPVSAQRSISSSTLAAGNTRVVPPPPSAVSGSAGGNSRVIALNLHPNVGAPPTPPAGNRRGAFAATPEGHAGASGNPGTASGTVGANGTGNGSGKENGPASNRKGSSNLPAGLYVGNAAKPETSPVAGDSAVSSARSSVNPNLVASLPPPRVTSKPTHPLEPGNASKLSEPERQVFGDRKFYALTLNMPNLNSAGGSWVIRFAELKPDANQTTPADLSAPAATHKVDPAYPMQLMRQNVAGTVILSAVIHADGTVGNVRVIRSIDDRIDKFASEAIARWQFAPATKNGAPIDVEATFQIPFRPARFGSNF